MNNIIEFRNVTIKYDYTDSDSNIVLNNISCSVEKGSFVAVLGHNGSGKSTFAKLINGILIPTSGKVFVNGLDTSDEKNIPEIRRTAGMVFQNPDNQIVATIVEDDVAFGPENLGVEPEIIRERVDDALKTVGMYDYRHNEPHNLSGGQKQRVAIAGVIAMQTDCIILDEPTAMLDPHGRKSVMKTIKKLNRELGITVIFITHYMNEAVQADRVIVLNDGNIVMDDEPRKIFSQADALKKYGLDVPQSTDLVLSLRKKGYTVPDDVLNADEFVSSFMELINE